MKIFVERTDTSDKRLLLVPAPISEDNIMAGIMKKFQLALEEIVKVEVKIDDIFVTLDTDTVFLLAKESQVWVKITAHDRYVTKLQ